MIFSVSKRPTIAEIHNLYSQNKASVEDLTRFFINRSQEVDKKLNGVSYITEQKALQEAQEMDEIKSEFEKNEGKSFFEKLIQKYPLFGIPYFVKSIILIEGETFNAGSKILNGFKASYSSTVYLNCNKAGAVLLGIANMDEFATGASGETCAYGPAKNPFDTNRVPGGSSSGPAVVVASGQCVFSLGTDTGGSIRQPAAFTDTVGIKPTYGLVSRYGVMPMASSFDQVGAFTNNVSDNINVIQVISGKDPKDQTSLDSQKLKESLENYQIKKVSQRHTDKIKSTANPLKIGIPKEFYVDGIDPQIRAALENIQKQLKQIGHELVEVSLPISKYGISVYYMTMPVELSANLERYDGVRYALQENAKGKDLFYSQRENFGAEVTRRIMLGTYASSAGYYDAYYNHAQKVRQLAKKDFDKVFEEVDILLTPVTPEFPFKLGSKTNDPLSMYLSDVFTCGINPVRIPGISIPLGLFDVYDEETKETVKLPTGAQLLGPEISENILFQVGEEIEKLLKL
jgi:aspartyl-tRNA(Asn)/glutamyl-tRNA(Gln) amidotransferase subunit A